MLVVTILNYFWNFLHFLQTSRAKNSSQKRKSSFYRYGFLLNSTFLLIRILWSKRSKLLYLTVRVMVFYNNLSRTEQIILMPQKR
jgi:hypothetical protein